MPSEVTTPAPDQLLATLANVKLGLSIASTNTSQDALLTRKIAEASAAIGGHLHRVDCLGRQTYLERLPGDGTTDLQLNRYPVEASPITCTIWEIPTTDFYLRNPKAGILYS